MNHNNFTTFRGWLKVMLYKHEMKQKELAAKLNTSEACVSRWIHGNRLPDNESMKKILELFDSHIQIVPNKTIQCKEGTSFLNRDVVLAIIENSNNIHEIILNVRQMPTVEIEGREYKNEPC